jgi:hypothetical protein
MPVILAALLVIILVLFALVVLIPISIVQRYRTGTMRRRAQGWLVTINLAGIAVSITLFLISAALTSIWIPQSFTYAAAGVGVGLGIGVIGLLLTRWEYFPGTLYYTPNRWLVLALTLAVAGRIGYGFWRTYETWTLLGGDAGWVAASGVTGSLAAGGVILGYYLVYWAGVRRRSARVFGLMPGR